MASAKVGTSNPFYVLNSVTNDDVLGKNEVNATKADVAPSVEQVDTYKNVTKNDKLID